MSKIENITPTLLGGDLQTIREKKRKNFIIDNRNHIPQALIAAIANAEQNHDIFGNIEELQPVIEAASKNQSKHPLNKLFLAYNNIVQRNFYDHEMNPIELKDFFTLLSQQGVQVSNDFEGCGQVLKELAKSFLSVEEKDGEDNDESEDDESENEEKLTEDEKRVREFKKLSNQGRNVQKIMNSISFGKLMKFLNLKVNHTSELYSVIEDIRYILHLCLDIPLESIKFTGSEIIQLYLGRPFSALINKKRLIFLEKFSVKKTGDDDESAEEDDDEESEADDDSDDKDKEAESEDEKKSTEETEKKEEGSKQNDNKRNQELQAKEVAEKLRSWINSLTKLFQNLMKKDLDNTKVKTFDKTHQEIRTYECNKLKWTYAPLGENFDVTLIKMKDECEVNVNAFGVSIIRDEVMYQFEDVQISNYNNSSTQTYSRLKNKLSELLTIPIDNYIIARAYSSKSAIFKRENSEINQEFINDVICYYNINSNELADIKKGTKDFLFIKITETYLFVLILELTTSLNKMIDIILSKFKKHNIQFSPEELRQKLLWNDSPISWENKFSYFVDRKDTCKFADSGVMFTFNGSEADKPVYKNERYPHSINLKMEVSNIMTHFYKINMEKYRKQEFNLITMTPTVIGYEISQFSSKYDFCNNYDILLKDIDEENEDVTRTYRVFAIVLKKPTKKTSSRVFLYDEKEANFKSLEKEEIIGFEDMTSKFINMVYYVRKRDERGEDRMEEI